MFKFKVILVWWGVFFVMLSGWMFFVLFVFLIVIYCVNFLWVFYEMVCNGVYVGIFVDYFMVIGEFVGV